MYIKRKIIELCDEMITFWDGFEKEIEAIPNENEADIILMWHDYFEEHGDIVGTLGMTKRLVNEVEKRLIMQGELKMEGFNYDYSRID